MNKYPEWWDTTITIYNKYENPLTNLVTWYKHTIDGAFWKYVGDKVKMGQTVIETNSIVCRIRKDDKFKENYEWINLPNDVKGNYFTLGVGDVIIKGEVEDEINEYTSGTRSTDLIKKYKKSQGCLEIEQVAIDIGPGRCLEHYRVKGI